MTKFSLMQWLSRRTLQCAAGKNPKVAMQLTASCYWQFPACLSVLHKLHWTVVSAIWRNTTVTPSCHGQQGLQPTSIRLCHNTLLPVEDQSWANTCQSVSLFPDPILTWGWKLNGSKVYAVSQVYCPIKNAFGTNVSALHCNPQSELSSDITVSPVLTPPLTLGHLMNSGPCVLGDAYGDVIPSMPPSHTWRCDKITFTQNHRKDFMNVSNSRLNMKFINFFFPECADIKLHQGSATCSFPTFTTNRQTGLRCKQSHHLFQS